MNLKKTALMVLLLAQIPSVLADTLQLKPNYPALYEVKKGDTLWDISGLYLEHPWHWPKLWQHNPQIANPDLIYPGDRLHLYFVNGEPRLNKEINPSSAKREIIITPKMWSESKLNPISTLPLANIAPFLRRDYLFPTTQAVTALPYVIGNSDQPIGMVGNDSLYLAGTLAIGQHYGLYREGTIYKREGQVIGQEAILSGVIRTEENLPNGQTRATLINNQLEVRSGDRALPLPVEGELPLLFAPQAAPKEVSGQVVEIPSKSSGAGKYEVVLVDVGSRQNMQQGMILEIDRPGAKLVESRDGKWIYKDRSSVYDQLFHNGDTQLPDETMARIMLFRVYPDLSYALILESSDLVRVGYQIHGL